VGPVGAARLSDLTDRTTGRAQRRPEEKRARLLSAARQVFGQAGYDASVHEICRVAGVGIGTFYHQFPDKAALMRLLMEGEHDFRVRSIDALDAQEDVVAQLVRILAGSDPALLKAMIEAGGVDAKLNAFGRGLRIETREHLTAAFERIRRLRGTRRPALEAATASWVTLALSDTPLDRDTPSFAQVINVVAFGETDGARVRA
jgi:AcrR family transcriptional regulator